MLLFSLILHTYFLTTKMSYVKLDFYTLKIFHNQATVYYNDKMVNKMNKQDKDFFIQIVFFPP